MGFMDKAKKFAQEAQQQAKDGTLKERAKALAEQAQHKLDEVQGQFNERQKGGAAEGPPVEYDAHGRPITNEPPAAPDAPVTPEPAAAEAAEAAPSAPPPPPVASDPGPAPEAVGDVDRRADEAPKITGGDPLAG